MEGYGRSAPIRVSKLAVRPALAHLYEPEPLKERDDLARLEDRDRAWHSGDLDCLDTDELGLKLWLPILQEHLHNLLKVSRNRSGVSWLDTVENVVGIGSR